MDKHKRHRLKKLRGGVCPHGGCGNPLYAGHSQCLSHVLASRERGRAYWRRVNGKTPPHSCGDGACVKSED